MGNKTYPIMYYCRGEAETDKYFILERMRAIPGDLKDEVSERYEAIYKRGLGDCRRLANEYLHSVAKEYRDKTLNQNMENGNYGHLPEKKEVKKTFTNSGTKQKETKPGRKTILGFIESGITFNEPAPLPRLQSKQAVIKLSISLHPPKAIGFM